MNKYLLSFPILAFTFLWSNFAISETVKRKPAESEPQLLFSREIGEVQGSKHSFCFVTDSYVKKCLPGTEILLASPCYEKPIKFTEPTLKNLKFLLSLTKATDRYADLQLNSPGMKERFDKNSPKKLYDVGPILMNSRGARLAENMSAKTPKTAIDLESEKLEVILDLIDSLCN